MQFRSGCQPIKSGRFAQYRYFPLAVVKDCRDDTFGLVVQYRKSADRRPAGLSDHRPDAFNEHRHPTGRPRWRYYCSRGDKSDDQRIGHCHYSQTTFCNGAATRLSCSQKQRRGLSMKEEGKLFIRAAQLAKEFFAVNGKCRMGDARRLIRLQRYLSPVALRTGIRRHQH